MAIKPVQILGISGSPRKGATSKALQIALQAAAEVPNVQTQCIDLAGKRINCCLNCNVCRKNNLPRCPVFQDDFTDAYLELYRNCDAILLATPLYLMNPTGLLSNFLGRMRPNGSSPAQRALLHSRVGAAIAVGGRRNGGQDLALSALNAVIQSSGSSVIGGGVVFYNGAAVWSKNEKDFDDPTGVMELRAVGRKLAFTTRIMQAGISALSLRPENYAGFLTEEEQQEAYALIGL